MYTNFVVLAVVDGDEEDYATAAVEDTDVRHLQQTSITRSPRPSCWAKSLPAATFHPWGNATHKKSTTFT